MIRASQFVLHHWALFGLFTVMLESVESSQCGGGPESFFSRGEFEACPLPLHPSDKTLTPIDFHLFLFLKGFVE
jgi:hypothetical protein